MTLYWRFLINSPNQIFQLYVRQCIVFKSIVKHTFALIRSSFINQWLLKSKRIIHNINTWTERVRAYKLVAQYFNIPVEVVEVAVAVSELQLLEVHLLVILGISTYIKVIRHINLTFFIRLLNIDITSICFCVWKGWPYIQAHQTVYGLQQACCHTTKNVIVYYSGKCCTRLSSSPFKSDSSRVQDGKTPDMHKVGSQQSYKRDLESSQKTKRRQ